jgi:hypothetical protein
MARELDLRGTIGPTGVDAIRRSILYRALSAECGDVEVWQAERDLTGGWYYYWLVSRARGVVRGLALVRYSLQLDEVQERIDGPFGQELWATVPVAQREAPPGAARDQAGEVGSGSS